jgi:hypothetical protein
MIKAIFKAVGRGNANVEVCKKPLLGGVYEALKWDRIKEVLKGYRGMVELFLLIVDRDGEASRRAALDQIEKKAAEYLGENRCLFAENAWQELEVWVLAGHDLPKAWAWKDIRKDLSPKENYFTPFAEQKSLQDEPYEGRESLALEAAKRYSRIRKLCPEDVVNLESRIKEWITR